MKKFALLLIPAFAIGCGNACDKAGDRIVAKYDECGVDTTESEDEGEDVECTDELAEQSECLADVIEAADCSYLDGSVDPTDEAYLEWATSSAECV
ncbi:MAG: hypothetical protein ACOZNI_14430 [Myxococcota bacterium]